MGGSIGNNDDDESPRGKDLSRDTSIDDGKNR